MGAGYASSTDSEAGGSGKKRPKVGRSRQNAKRSKGKAATAKDDNAAYSRADSRIGKKRDREQQDVVDSPLKRRKTDKTLPGGTSS